MTSLVPPGGWGPYPKRRSEKATVEEKARIRRGVLRQRSKKREALDRVYAKLRAEYLEEHPQCEYGPCTARAVDLHHKTNRSQSLAGLTDPGNFAALCREHHDWVGEHPAEAREIGLSVFGWQYRGGAV